MRAQCVLPSGITQVGETQTVDVTNCDGNHCFQEDIHYEAAMPQIIALLESSSSCSQTIDFQCFSAPLKVMINTYMIGLELLAVGSRPASSRSHMLFFCYCHPIFCPQLFQLNFFVGLLSVSSLSLVLSVL